MKTIKLKSYAAILIVVFAATSLFGQIQLKEKVDTHMEKAELFLANGKEIIVDQKGIGSGNIKINGVSTKALSNDEQIVHTTADFIYTLRTDGDCSFGSGSYLLVKKVIDRGGISNVAETSFSCVGRTVHFFDNGNFVLREALEEGGHAFQFYSNTLNLIKEFVPNDNGYSYSFININKDKVFIGTKPNDSSKSFLMSYLDSQGNVLFKYELNSDINDLSKVLTSDNFLAVHGSSVNPPTQKVYVFDPKGSLIFEKKIKTAVRKWSFSKGNTAHLLLGYQEGLAFYDVNSGELLGEKQYQDIYSEAGLKSNRSDGYTEIIDIVSLSNLNCILLSEPNIGGRSNNVLYVLQDSFSKNTQVLSLEDSKQKPIIKASNSQLIILQDNKLSRYE
jgi:hypothetical protein